MVNDNEMDLAGHGGWVTDQAPQGALPTPRTDALIESVMTRFPGQTARSDVGYYYAVHQKLAPFAREQEATIDAQARQIEELRAENIALRREVNSLSDSLDSMPLDLATAERELAAAQQALADANYALRWIRHDIHHCDWRCGICGSDPGMKETDLYSRIESYEKKHGPLTQEGVRDEQSNGMVSGGD